MKRTNRDDLVKGFKEVGADKNFSPVELEELIITFAGDDGKINVSVRRSANAYFKRVERGLIEK